MYKICFGLFKVDFGFLDVEEVVKIFGWLVGCKNNDFLMSSFCLKCLFSVYCECVK